MTAADFLASFSVTSPTAVSSWSRGTTRFTKPIDCICIAVQRSPSIAISSSTLRGRFRDRTAWIIIGHTPTLISGVAKVAVSTATKRSHDAARPNPPANACPLIRPTTGLPSSPIKRNSSTNACRPRCRSGSGMLESKLVRSAPAEKLRSPAPVSTTTRIASWPWHQVRAAIRSRSMPTESGLRCSGRLRVTVATGPMVATSTFSRAGISVKAAHHPRAPFQCRGMGGRARPGRDATCIQPT